MPTIIDYAEAGMASIQSDSFITSDLFSGDADVSTTSELVAAATVAGADLPAFSVVGYDGSNNLVMARTVGPILPIGITTAPVKMGATNLNVAVFRSGMFNPGKLNWHADYTTDDLKKHAFDNSTACEIYIKKPAYDGVVS